MAAGGAWVCPCGRIMLVQEGDLAVADHAGLVDADPGKIPDDHDELVFRVVGLGQVEDAGVGAAEGDVGEGGSSP